LQADEHRFVKVRIAKLQKSRKVHCSGQRIYWFQIQLPACRNQ